MSKKNKLSRASIASLILCILALVAFFLPQSTGSAMTDLSLKYAFNIVDIVKIIFNPGAYTGEASFVFAAPFLMSCIGLVLAFAALVVMIVLILRGAANGVKRVLAVCILFVTMFMGLLYNYLHDIMFDFKICIIMWILAVLLCLYALYDLFSCCNYIIRKRDLKNA